MKRRKIKTCTVVVKGSAHTACGFPCQDRAFTCKFDRGRSAIIALADGAGSCSHSHLGASLVTTNLGEMVHANFKQFSEDHKTARRTIVGHLQSNLRRLAESEGIDYSQLSSTLLFIFVKCTKGALKYFAGHIGDGVIISNNNGETRVLSHPDNGEFTNSTVFITSSEASRFFRMYSGTITGNSGFMLMSDGPGETLYNKSTRQPAPACQKIFGWLDQYSQKKCQRGLDKAVRDYIQPMTCDDCSLVALKTTGI